MGGELTLSSQLGEGSTFSVRLLLPSLGPDIGHEPHLPVIGYEGRRRRILVVDDQRDHRELLMSLLEPLGFYLGEADSGEECLSKVSEEQPDLILLDISMTGIDGIETAIRLRERELNMPIIILSANAYPSDRMAALNAGCNDFLAKPINVAELMHKLKLYLTLNWLYQGDDPSSIKHANPQSIQRPPPVLLSPCIDCVRIGDLLTLKRVLTQLRLDHPEYAAYCDRLVQLANQFRIGEIRQQLNMNDKSETR
jgi:CheY-like chemotaxis protein